MNNIAAIGLAIDIPNKAMDLLQNAPSCTSLFKVCYINIININSLFRNILLFSSISVIMFFYSVSNSVFFLFHCVNYLCLEMFILSYFLLSVHFRKTLRKRLKPSGITSRFNCFFKPPCVSINCNLGGIYGKYRA